MDLSFINRIITKTMFVDEAEITVRSGKGGDGMVHFHREKYINRGGPDGGDGGNGGDVIIKADPNINTLLAFRHKNKFIAEDGRNGGVNNQKGKSANNLIIPVPLGTMIYDAKSGDLLGDITASVQELLICKGGRGGRGNPHFANSRKQAPRIAEKGEPGQEKKLKLELKLIADIGIVGMPNAGKSSLLAALTNAKPKIAAYPFTTLIPNLGVTRVDEETTVVLADIPGLIEGAHAGVGLGDMFLKHLQRTRVLIHLINGESDQPFADFSQINSELALFDDGLMKKFQVVAVNKIDLPKVKEKWKAIKEEFSRHSINVMAISALSRENLDKLLYKSIELLKKSPPTENIPILPVYHPTARIPEFEISKISSGWKVSGEAIERAAAMTYWEYDDALRRFQRIMEAMGVDAALREAGVEEGDTIRIGDHELTWQD